MEDGTVAWSVNIFIFVSTWYNLRMNLKVGIVGLPNTGPSRTLAVPVVYVHASRCRVYGTARVGYIYRVGGAS